MKQKIQTLFTVALCAGSLFVNAQTSFNKVVLKQGQKLQVETTMKNVSTMEMMGQSMEITADVLQVNQVEVKAKNDNNYTITSTITKIVTNANVMGQTIAYDSEKKEDNESEMGKVMKDKINVPVEMDINDEGKISNIKKDFSKAAPENANPVMAMMGSNPDESNGANDAFLLLPAGSKAGDSWSDSSITEGIKIYKTYTIKSIQGNDVTVTLTGNQVVNKKVENQGMEANVAIESKITGEILADMATGIVKQRTLTLEGAGSTEAMGQSIPMTTKVTSISIVKSL